VRQPPASTLFATLITYKTGIADWRLAVRGHVGRWVVGCDHPGPTPPNLSSCSLFQWRREREREPGRHFFFFKKYPPHKQSSAEVSWQVVKHVFYFHVYHL